MQSGNNMHEKINAKGRAALTAIFCVGCVSLLFSQPATPVSGSNGKSRVEYLIIAGDSTLQNEMVQDAVGYYKLALKEAELLKWSEKIFLINIKLGQSFNKLSKYEEALLYLKHAEAMRDMQQPGEEQAKLFSLLGAVYESLGSYPEAFGYQFKSLSYRETQGDSLGIAESLYKIGSLLYYQKKYEEALTYYQRALLICEKNESIPPKYLFNCLSALGSTYEEMDRQEESLAYNLRSRDLAIQTGNEKNRAYALLNIGENYTNLGIYAKAKEHLLESLQLSKNLGIQRAEILSYQRLGELFLKLDRAEEAADFLYRAYYLCRDTGSKTLMLEVLELLAQAHEASYNYEAANGYLRLYAEVKDSILNETAVKEISRLSALYELEKKETAISLFQTERELSAAQEKAARLTTYMLIGASGLFLSLSAWLFYWVVNQRRSNKLLQRLNGHIETQNRQLQSYNEELRQYAYAASHDLQEPLRTIGAFVTILKRRHIDQFDDQAQQYMGYITDGVTRLQQLLRDLLTYTRIEREKTDFELVQSKFLIQAVLAGLQESIRASNVRIIVDQESLPVIYGNATRLSQVFQNLISNAVKFRGETDPLVEVGCMDSADKGEYVFYVRDNGIGIPPDFQEKMFEMFTRLHARDEYEGSGIGLATCRKIIDSHGGRIWAESEPGMGSAILFTLPMPDAAESSIKPGLSRAAAMLT
jgi:signal transduction histidine kinase